jgi:hypothetical protein
MIAEAAAERDDDTPSFDWRRGPIILYAVRLEGEGEASLHLGPLVFSAELTWPRHGWERHAVTFRWLTMNRGPRLSARLRLSRG